MLSDEAEVYKSIPISNPKLCLIPLPFTDMNGDGLDDVTRVSSDGIHIDYQNSDGTFLHKFFKKQIEVPPVYSICAGDLNNDGHNDLLFGGREKVSFLIYDLNVDQYIEQVMPQSITCQRATLFDIDNDGDLDAFVCNDAKI